MTYQVWDYGRTNPENPEQALYLGEVEAPTFKDAAALAREAYPDAVAPYVFNNDEKGFA